VPTEESVRRDQTEGDKKEKTLPVVLLSFGAIASLICGLDILLADYPGASSDPFHSGILHEYSTCVAFCAFFARLPPLPAVVAATDGTVEGDGVDGGSAPAIACADDAGVVGGDLRTF
jgi:hypothetical protein